MTFPQARPRAFTLVEMLLVIAIISILAAMVISSFSNAAQDTRNVIVNQQLAVAQEAVSTWASREIGRPTSGTFNGLIKPANSVTDVMTAYNSAGTAKGRFDLFKVYIDTTRDTATEALFTAEDIADGKVTTAAMRDLGLYLTLPDWADGSYPKVHLNGR